MTYNKVATKIYTDGEITDAITDMEKLLEMSNTDNLNQHFSCALLIALDCLNEEIDLRRHLCFGEGHAEAELSAKDARIVELEKRIADNAEMLLEERE